MRLFAIFFTLISFIGRSQYTGVATYFDDLGKPFGGCGVPESIVETPNYVALNVFNTPGSGTQYVRPITGNNLQYMGEFQNGRNCGRWVRVKILENCIDGMNDGALGQTFCRGGNAKWTQDKFYGAELDMIVTDACGDGNGWCRDSPYHLDLHTSSLSEFELNGHKTTGMYPTYFNNRKIEWEYIEAPNYSGDIKIHLMENAQRYYTPILITNLPNGIHKVEQKVNGKWENVPMNSDLGQSFVLPNNVSPYTIRVTDAEDNLLNDGREYTFRYPASCGTLCIPPTTEVPFTFVDPNPLSISDSDIYGSWKVSVHTVNGSAEVFLGDIPKDNLQLKVIDIVGKEISKMNVHLGVSDKLVHIGHYQKGFYKLLVYSNERLLSNANFWVNE